MLARFRGAGSAILARDTLVNLRNPMQWLRGLRGVLSPADGIRGGECLGSAPHYANSSRFAMILRITLNVGRCPLRGEVR